MRNQSGTALNRLAYASHAMTSAARLENSIGMTGYDAPSAPNETLHQPGSRPQAYMPRILVTVATREIATM